MKNDNYKAKECFVAFIDILGFTEMIIEDDGNGKNLGLIKKAIDNATKLLKGRKEEVNGPFHFWFKEFKVKSFSDCFCFSIPLEFEDGNKDYERNFVAFYVWLMVFHNQLLDAGFLCRGGITQGWHYVDDDLIFSKALVDAYLIESKLAKHPMIMISEKLLGEIKSKIPVGRDYLQYMFTHDISARCFLNPFNYGIVDEIYFGSESQHEKSLVREKDERFELSNRYIDILAKRISLLTDKGAADKYQWIKEFIKFTTNAEYDDKFKAGVMN